MLSTTSLDRLAICASYCAYFVKKDGRYQPDTSSPYYKNTHFIDKPIPFSKGEGIGLNAAIFAETQHYNVLAFRGTTESIWDWLQDADMIPITAPDLPGKVYGGIYKGFSTIKDEIINTLKAKKENGKPLLVTGHSKGGPMASYAAYLAKTYVGLETGVITFASPHPGDKDFADGFINAQIQQKRFENYQDIVPFFSLLPKTDSQIEIIINILKGLVGEFPTLEKILKLLEDMVKNAEAWDYAPLGELYYITKDYQVKQNVSYNYRLEQVGEVFLDPFEIFRTFDNAHILKLCDGYQRGVFPGLSSCG